MEAAVPENFEELLFDGYQDYLDEEDALIDLTYKVEII